MYKKWFAEVLALLISITGATQLHGSETDRLPNSGKEIVSQVESSYSKGAYDTFLSQLHEQYQNAGKAGAIRGIFESAKSAMKASPENIRGQLNKNRTELAELSKERNSRLLEAITANPRLPIADKVDTVVSYDLSSKEAEVLAELDALKYHIPETAIGTIDNKISALETEYYIKELLLNIASQTSKTTSEDFEQKKIAIQLEKLSRMEEEAKSANDNIWIEKIQTAKRAFRADKVFKIDYQVLQSLAAGNIAPENSVEEKVKQIMMDFQKEKQGTFDRNLSEIAQK